MNEKGLRWKVRRSPSPPSWRWAAHTVRKTRTLPRGATVNRRPPDIIYTSARPKPEGRDADAFELVSNIISSAQVIEFGVATRCSRLPSATRSSAWRLLHRVRMRRDDRVRRERRTVRDNMLR